MAPYVPPCRHAPGQKGALPPSRMKKATTESSLPRAARNRRPPERYRGDAWVRSENFICQNNPIKVSFISRIER